MMEKDFATFRNTILKNTGKGKQAKVRNSIGVYDIYKLIRKDKWQGIGRPLKEHEFYSIIRGINNLYAKELAIGNSMKLPYGMGTLELRKSQRGVRFANGKLKITYPIDWDKTLRLWFVDKEAKASKTLIRMEEGTVYHVAYSKITADYENKSFYCFVLNNKIKATLKDNIKRGVTDTMYDEY